MVVDKKKPVKKKVAKKKVARLASAQQRMEIHETECALRYKSIEERLAAGNVKFDKLEKLVWGIYPFILLLFVVEKFGG